MNQTLPELLFLTDSHGLYFTHAIKNHLLMPFKASVCKVNGATIAGLKNVDSFTAALDKYKNFLQNKSRSSLVFIQLGEVDCGILIWLKAEKNNNTIQEECFKTVDIYMQFIADLEAMGFNNIVVTSATLPTINDEDHIGEIISLRRKKVQATYRQRTDLTLFFNQNLEENCQKNSIEYIDATDSFLDKKTMSCDSKFRNKRIEDHHMEYSQACIVWANSIRSYIIKKYNLHYPSVKKIAVFDTYIKKLNKNSKTLDSDMLFKIKKTDVVNFEISDVIGQSLILEKVSVNDIELDSSFRFARISHFF